MLDCINFYSFPAVFGNCHGNFLGHAADGLNVCVDRIKLPLSDVTNAVDTVTTATLPGKCYSSTAAH